jgi:glycosyltransferase involved in cell wall biosynthesis
MRLVCYSRADYWFSFVGMFFMAQLSHSLPRFTTTLNYEHPQWQANAHVIPLPYTPPAPHRLIDELHYFSRVVKAGLRGHTLLLNSSSGKLYPELMAAAVLGLLPHSKRPWIAMMGSMWHVEPGLKYQVERAIVRLANRAIQCYIVQSTEELETFPKIWSVEKNKTRLCLYFHTFTDADLAIPPSPHRDYIFAGGNAHRDYAPLIDAARQLPNEQFIVATNRIQPDETTPPNVTICAVPHEEFVALMRSAKLVVVPIRHHLLRAAGQQTYLNAMLMKKLTVVNEGFAVHDHLRHQENALIVDGSATGYVDAIKWALNPQNSQQVAHICEQGYRDSNEKFSYDRHINRLIEILHEAHARP